MRRIRYSVAMSLDGYIAAPDGSHAWIVMDPDIDFGEIYAEFDTLLMGRKTYEPMLSADAPSGSDKPMKSYVFSRTLAQEDHPDVTIVKDDFESLLSELRAAEGKDIWLFGGGELFGTLLAAGLVDTVEVAVIPTLLGGGTPLLPAPAPQTRLRLREHRVLAKTGTVVLAYDIERATKP